MNVKHALVPATVLMGLLAASVASARRIEDWSYDRLMSEADVVVIAVATENAPAPERTAENPWHVEFEGIHTTFRVQLALKGKPDGTLTVLHFHVGENAAIEDGPLHVSFRTDSAVLHLDSGGTKMNVSTGRPDYLLFLKARSDGRYELVSGRIDSSLSTRELHPNMNWIEHLRNDGARSVIAE